MLFVTFCWPTECRVVRRTQGRSPVSARSPAYLRVFGFCPRWAPILSRAKVRKWCMCALCFLAKNLGITSTLRSQVPVSSFQVAGGTIFSNSVNNRSFTLSLSSPEQLQRTVVGLGCGLIGMKPLPVPTDLVFTVSSCFDRLGSLRPVWRSLPLCILLLCLAIVFQLLFFPLLLG